MPHRRHQLGKRRVALLFGALTCLTRSLAYIPGVRRSPVQEPIVALTLGRGWLLWAYLAAWAVVGLCCLLALRRGSLRPLIAMVTLMIIWGVAWLSGYLQVSGTDWWQTAVTYGGPAGVIGSLLTMIPLLMPHHPEAPEAAE